MKKGIFFLSLILLVGAGCVSAPPVPAPDPVPLPPVSAPPAQTPPVAAPPFKMNIEDGNFFFKPATITVSAGQTVELTFTMHAGFHTFVIPAIGLKKQISQGATVTFTAPAEPGSYPFYCDVGNHRASGMEGSLIVK